MFDDIDIRPETSTSTSGKRRHHQHHPDSHPNHHRTLDRVEKMKSFPRGNVGFIVGDAMTVADLRLIDVGLYNLGPPNVMFWLVVTGT